MGKGTLPVYSELAREYRKQMLNGYHGIELEKDLWRHRIERDTGA
jgi:hypothetical protein